MHDHDDLERLRNLKPHHVLRAICVIESRLTAAGSTSGIVAERMKLGMATRSGYEGDGADRTRRELTWLLGLTRDLTEQEQRVCRAHYGSTAGSVQYEDLRKVADLQEGDGEDVIDVRPVDPAGQPLGGRVGQGPRRPLPLPELGGDRPRPGPDQPAGPAPPGSSTRQGADRHRVAAHDGRAGEPLRVGRSVYPPPGQRRWSTILQARP